MRVKALVNDVYYDGKNHNKGDEFDVQDEHGQLMAINETVAEVTTRAMKSEADDGKRNRYKRRDMRADE